MARGGQRMDAEMRRGPGTSQRRRHGTGGMGPARPESPGLGPAWAGLGFHFMRPEPKPWRRAWPGPAWAQAGAWRSKIEYLLELSETAQLGAFRSEVPLVYCGPPTSSTVLWKLPEVTGFLSFTPDSETGAEIPNCTGETDITLLKGPARLGPAGPGLEGFRASGRAVQNTSANKSGREGEGRAWKQQRCVWRWAVYAAACRMERGRGRGNMESASRSREAGSTSDDDDREGGKRRDESGHRGWECGEEWIAQYGVRTGGLTIKAAGEAAQAAGRQRMRRMLTRRCCTIEAHGSRSGMGKVEGEEEVDDKVASGVGSWYWYGHWTGAPMVIPSSLGLVESAPELRDRQPALYTEFETAVQLWGVGEQTPVNAEGREFAELIMVKELVLSRRAHLSTRRGTGADVEARRMHRCGGWRRHGRVRATECSAKVQGKRSAKEASVERRQGRTIHTGVRCSGRWWGDEVGTGRDGHAVECSGQGWRWHRGDVASTKGQRWRGAGMRGTVRGQLWSRQGGRTRGAQREG
ncbi:hypothetical protein B0H14DRAFT_2566205 [Mycena olivaceomarginata]|nr:hypothetical protein B0H14DRAFT_2566205 [Mycena olivaceomarginata]